MSQYKLYKTSYDNFDLRIQSNNYIQNFADAIKLIDVTISTFGKIELKEFSDIEQGLSYNLNKGLSYKFVELKEDVGPGFYYIAENNAFDKKAYLTSQMKVIGNNWNLYLNSWDNVYAQGIGEVPNSRFSFTNDNRKYLYLSVLLYTLTHIEHQDLETEFEKNQTSCDYLGKQIFLKKTNIYPHSKENIDSIIAFYFVGFYYANDHLDFIYNNKSNLCINELEFIAKTIIEHIQFFRVKLLNNGLTVSNLMSYGIDAYTQSFSIGLPSRKEITIAFSNYLK